MILPKTPIDFIFDETVKRLSETFREKSSVVNIRYKCLKLAKKQTILTLASIFNRECEKSKLGEIAEDQIKVFHHPTFKTEFETRRKYLTVTIDSKPIRLQLYTASDISLPSKRAWQMTGRPPMITSDKKIVEVLGRFLRPTGELICDVSFDGTQFKETCYPTSRLRLHLIGHDQIVKLGLLELSLNHICNSVQSTWPSAAKLYQLTAKLMSTLKAKFSPIFQDGHAEEDSSSEDYAIIDGIAERIARLVSASADNHVAPFGEQISDSDITFDRSLPGLHTYLGEDVVNVDGRNHIQPGEILNLRAFYRPGIILVPGYTLPLLIQEATQIDVLRAFKDSVAILPGCFSRRILYDDFVGRVATIADLMTIRQSGNLQNPVLLGRQRLEIISVQPSYERSAIVPTSSK
ncbi:unnamed protein product [Dibothriocephalus latus]|uniref:Uncharacterized protein n=1 Tax=Dibothriocephalus latus TaxID=60516 RepID=A0A3P7P3Y8_DIBLA|nr:unnamed protein product [Dibothriocephalus latus]